MKAILSAFAVAFAVGAICLTFTSLLYSFIAFLVTPPIIWLVLKGKDYLNRLSFRKTSVPLTY